MSVTDQVCLGSAVSFLSFARFGSGLSIHTGGRVEISLFVHDSTLLGSCMSVRLLVRFSLHANVVGSTRFSIMQIGERMSTLSFAHLGNSLFLRAFNQLGSSVSITAGNQQIRRCACWVSRLWAVHFQSSLQPKLRASLQPKLRATCQWNGGLCWT